MKHMKMKFCLILAMIFLAGSTVSAAPRSEYSACYVHTQGGNLNCRKGPGTKYAIIGKFKNGTRLAWSIFGTSIDSEGNYWQNVTGKDINGKTITGYVSEDYLIWVDEDYRSVVIVDENMPDVG